MPFPKAVTEYFKSIPVEHRQRIVDTMKAGVAAGSSKTEIRLKLVTPNIPAIPSDAYNDLYEMMLRAKKWGSL